MRESRQPIGIVGLGLVGSALGARLRAAGFQTIGFDLQRAACNAFHAAGGVLAESPQALGAQVSQVILALFDSRDVNAVLSDPDGVLASGGVTHILDCSTGTPAVSAELAARLSTRNFAFIEAPLSGSSAQIAQGQATLLLGGETIAIAQCTALLQAITDRRIHVGVPGMAGRAKLATNLVLGLNRAALAEGFAFAESLGIARADFLALVLATPASSQAAVSKGALMVTEDFTPQSRIRQHLKDVELMLTLAEQNNLSLPLSEVHAQLMQQAVAAGDGDLDNAAIIKQWRRL